MSFTKDIAGKEFMMLGAVIEVLKFVGEKEDLFAVFPIGATIQDGGKRKRSDGFCRNVCSRMENSFCKVVINENC